VSGLAVAPRAGAWIETIPGGIGRQLVASRPARARGLKPVPLSLLNQGLPSRPARARGLKLILFRNVNVSSHVAPRAGAWIETWPKSAAASPAKRRAPRGRVD